ncbi:hypothetical protein PROFUN_02500 [Planoprotostelium fungivorum]|uniref:Uncharacterized protein n=1 Tax=Planoprotostelium fungivorum TaxID=1890364 RepID=A0A2P6MP63_9EUKA|nr:hypothetical protein PROFUN_02500 [Planoprotostelium fungivorum]
MHSSLNGYLKSSAMHVRPKASASPLNDRHRGRSDVQMPKKEANREHRLYSILTHPSQVTQDCLLRGMFMLHGVGKRCVTLQPSEKWSRPNVK